MLQNLLQSPHPTRVATQKRPIDSTRSRNDLSEDGLCSPIETRQDPATGEELPSPIGLDALATSQDDGLTLQHESPWTQIGRLDDSAGLSDAQSLDLNQACLLRYFVDNLSQWVC